MKLKNYEIYAAVESLEKLVEIKLPVKTSFELAKLADAIGAKFRIAEEVRLSLVNQYGEKNADGQSEVKQNSKNWNAFIEDYNELMKQETEVVINPVVLPPNIEIEPSILINLVKMVAIE